MDRLIETESAKNQAVGECAVDPLAEFRFVRVTCDGPSPVFGIGYSKQGRGPLCSVKQCAGGLVAQKLTLKQGMAALHHLYMHESKHGLATTENENALKKFYRQIHRALPHGATKKYY